MNEEISPPPIPDAPTPKRFSIKFWLMTSYILIIGAVFMASMILIWSLHSTNVLQIHKQPFAVHPPVVQPNSYIIASFDYCKLQRVHGTVDAHLVGKKSIIRLPWPDDDQSPKCVQTDVALPIPESASNDEYYFDFKVTYHFNPLKTTTVELRSQPFTVQSDSKVLQ